MQIKRIEATVQADKSGAVSDAKGIVEGFTILEGNSRDVLERDKRLDQEERQVHSLQNITKLQ
jgi:hypothetical protein